MKNLVLVFWLTSYVCAAVLQTVWESPKVKSTGVDIDPNGGPIIGQMQLAIYRQWRGPLRRLFTAAFLGPVALVTGVVKYPGRIRMVCLLMLVLSLGVAVGYRSREFPFWIAMVPVAVLPMCFCWLFILAEIHGRSC